MASITMFICSSSSRKQINLTFINPSRAFHVQCGWISFRLTEPLACVPTSRCYSEHGTAAHVQRASERLRGGVGHCSFKLRERGGRCTSPPRILATISWFFVTRSGADETVLAAQRQLAARCKPCSPSLTCKQRGFVWLELQTMTRSGTSDRTNGSTLQLRTRSTRTSAARPEAEPRIAS